MNDLSLIELYNYPAVNQLSGFARFAEALDISHLAQKYQDLVENAPRRQDAGKQYFVGHPRFEPREGSNRKEEHLAGALFNHCQEGKSLILPDNRELKIIDYQFPLKARQGDKGIGKIDLFGVIDQTIPCVIELKVDQDGGTQPDTPLRALLEGLAYCAMVEANRDAIQKEANSKFGLSLQSQGLDLIVLGPEKYWKYFINNEPAGPWQDTIRQLIVEASNNLPVTISLLSIPDSPLGTESPSNPKGPLYLHDPF